MWTHKCHWQHCSIKWEAHSSPSFIAMTFMDNTKFLEWKNKSSSFILPNFILPKKTVDTDRTKGARRKGLSAHELDWIHVSPIRSNVEHMHYRLLTLTMSALRNNRQVITAPLQYKYSSTCWLLLFVFFCAWNSANHWAGNNWGKCLEELGFASCYFIPLALNVVFSPHQQCVSLFHTPRTWHCSMIEPTTSEIVMWQLDFRLKSTSDPHSIHLYTNVRRQDWTTCRFDC